ncbi:GNAT family N-acetyltransferase [Planococcus versutus]|uniref:Spermidine acetyltransferase n=1 Tax=Planococcus versutus TaxID=1302659 RepID=A0A1B1S190_9BACL|nr:GNAT family N-acetyltransferase [Planococcus versutus]ANU26941.1 spermidine acetyltransferase [Planococcus versutus]
MVTEIRTITDLNKKEVLNLKVATQQQGFIESVSQCLLDAERDTRYVPLALYEEDTVIGFSMQGEFDGEIWLDRYLIDERFQGQGLGRYFLRALVDHLNECYPNQPIYLSVFEHNTIAIHLYQKFGFSFTEKFDENGEKIMIYSH